MIAGGNPTIMYAFARSAPLADFFGYFLVRPQESNITALSVLQKGIPSRKTNNQSVEPFGSADWLFSYLRIIFSYCCSSSFRRGLNITRAMKKLPMQWEMSKGMPEIHLVTAY